MGDGLKRARAAARASRQPVQKRNPYKMTVTFPADWADAPILAGTTQDLFYPTAEAMDLAARGFEMRGCGVR